MMQNLAMRCGVLQTYLLRLLEILHNGQTRADRMNDDCSNKKAFQSLVGDKYELS